jgi:hypothetical protein
MAALDQPSPATPLSHRDDRIATAVASCIQKQEHIIKIKGRGDPRPFSFER